MSDDESVLARWSRQKLAQAQDAKKQAKLKNADAGALSEAVARDTPPSETQPSLGPPALPPVETIAADSDVRAFLAAGVHADLTRAALRRAWSADPAIRDFIGLSENSWNFNVPDGVPGFGSLNVEDIGQLISQVMGEEDAEPAQATGESLPAEITLPTSRPGPVAELAYQQVSGESADDRPGHDNNTSADHRNLITQAQLNESVQHDFTELESAGRPRHGGALPK